jgi:hypothetical protein
MDDVKVSIRLNCSGCPERFRAEQHSPFRHQLLTA